MFLPIIVCQFFYMPFVAVPAWHTPTWTPGIEPGTAAFYPSVVIANTGYQLADGVAVTLSQPSCNVRKSASQPWVNCDVSGVQTSYVIYDKYEFVTFNSTVQSSADWTTDIASATATLMLSANIHCEFKDPLRE